MNIVRIIPITPKGYAIAYAVPEVSTAFAT